MEAVPHSPPPTEDFGWIDPARCRNIDDVRGQLDAIWRCGATPDLLVSLKDRLIEQSAQLDDLDSAVTNLNRFVAASRNPISLLALFERDAGALPALLQVFATSQTLASRLIADPESFDLLRASDGQPAERRYLVDELVAELASIDRPSQAAIAIRKFVSREIVRIAYAEFARGLSPENVGRQLSHVADAVIEAGLQFVKAQLVNRYGQPQLADGTIPEVTVIGLGNYGGQELAYGSPLKLVLLYDRIDHLNNTHQEFYQSVANDLVSLLTIDKPLAFGIELDLRPGPKYETGTRICSVRDAIRIYETSGRTWQRIGFIKARVVAGSQALGESFLRRLQPWVYRRFIGRAELADIRAMRRKLERRADAKADTSTDQDNQGGGADVVSDPGGRRDIEGTIQFLQLLHGGDLVDVRKANANEAMVALEKSGCITHQEATTLSENYARLCRLQHQLAVMFDRSDNRVPQEANAQSRLAWQLGIRAKDGSGGDLERFQQQLSETFEVNRVIINHLMLDAPHDGDAVAVETELMLDPEPDPTVIESVLSRHGIAHPARAMDDLTALATESVSFLSPRRCRHFFSAIAPALLAEISLSPDPDAALSSLVEVADSLGAKATLWELLGVNPPTMHLVVRLCAVTPYLKGILTKNPGMIDELVDSLLMDRLPSADRLDAQSIEVCRGATDIDLILQSFKNAAHLTIGVRDMLGKESIETTHQAIGDTAEACLRRITDHEQQKLASQFGDPHDEEGEPAELLTLALGKLGGREPNYHSDLDAVFLYSGEGETKRRLGGHRSTTSNQVFFNQLSQQVILHVNQVGTAGRLYELDGRLRPTGEDGVLAVSIDSFLKRFQLGTAPLWQRLALCKARSISGSRRLRKSTDKAINDVLCSTQWHSGMAAEIRELRLRMQQTATAENLKRGEGGTVDVEVVAQMLTLRHAAQDPSIIHQGTTRSLTALAKAGFLDEEQSLALINGYRTLRGVEANLRLMNTSARHELPTSDEALKNLAFLMNEDDPNMIVAQCQQARQSNRRLFDQILSAASES